jgi:hypothetical protein
MIWIDMSYFITLIDCDREYIDIIYDYVHLIYPIIFVTARFFVARTIYYDRRK